MSQSANIGPLGPVGSIPYYYTDQQQQPQFWRDRLGYLCGSADARIDDVELKGDLDVALACVDLMRRTALSPPYNIPSDVVDRCMAEAAAAAAAATSNEASELFASLRRINTCAGYEATPAPVLCIANMYQCVRDNRARIVSIQRALYRLLNMVVHAPPFGVAFKDDLADEASSGTLFTEATAAAAAAATTAM